MMNYALTYGPGTVFVSMDVSFESNWFWISHGIYVLNLCLLGTGELLLLREFLRVYCPTMSSVTIFHVIEIAKALTIRSSAYASFIFVFHLLQARQMTYFTGLVIQHFVFFFYEIGLMAAVLSKALRDRRRTFTNPRLH